YDQDQVDDFLDEVVVELRRLNQENEELRAQLAGTSTASASVAVVAPVAVVEPEPQPEPEPEPQPEPEPVNTPEPVSTNTATIIMNGPEDETGTTSLLVLARRLHEEHVREGVEKRDALIAEGHATAARLVSEAENQKKEVLDQLESQRSALQVRVEELRVFEGEYRRKIKTHLEELISELNSTGTGD
ncbi:MAG: DivIVA domain-containing protein, partial [Agromyces sp.]